MSEPKSSTRIVVDRMVAAGRATQRRQATKARKARKQRAVVTEQSERQKALKEIVSDLYNTKAYKDWRNYVFLRDKYTCQMCGLEGGSLECHHIRPKAKFPDLALDPDNGITLCKYCHQMIVTGSELRFLKIFPLAVKLNKEAMEAGK